MEDQWKIEVQCEFKYKSNKKGGVTNDPLGQTRSLARSEHCFRLKFVLIESGSASWINKSRKIRVIYVTRLFKRIIVNYFTILNIFKVSLQLCTGKLLSQMPPSYTFEALHTDGHYHQK